MSYQPLSIPQILAMLKARRKLILWATAGIFLLTAALTVALPKTWTASTDLYIDYRENDPITGQRISAMLDDGYLQTQIELLRSEKVAQAAIEQLRWHDSAAYRRAMESRGREKANRQFLDAFMKRIAIQHARSSRVVTVQFSAQDPQQARNGANAIAHSYLALSKQIALETGRQRFEQYNAQLSTLRTEIDDIQQQMTAYQLDNQLVSAQDHETPERIRLDALNKTLLTLEERLSTARANQSMVRQLLSSGIPPSELPKFNETGIINTLKSQLGFVDQQLGKVQGALGPNHPSVKGLLAERSKLLGRINVEADAMLAGLQSEIDGLGQQVKETRDSADEQRMALLDQMQQRNRLNAYQRELASAQKVYETALKSYDELIMASHIQPMAVSILSEAQAPVAPSKPKLRLNLAAGLMAGLLVGLMLALALEFSQRRIHLPADLETDPELPFLGLTSA